MLRTSVYRTNKQFTYCIYNLNITHSLYSPGNMGSSVGNGNFFLILVILYLQHMTGNANAATVLGSMFNPSILQHEAM
jgi:hypothetical protein